MLEHRELRGLCNQVVACQIAVGNVGSSARHERVARTNILLLGRQNQQRFSFEWQTGKKTRLQSPGGKTHEVHIENFVLAFPIASPPSSFVRGTTSADLRSGIGGPRAASVFL